MFAAGIPSNQVSGGVAGVQVPPVIFGFPSGLQQPVTVASTGGAHSVGQTSVGPVKLSPPKPSTTSTCINICAMCMYVMSVRVYQRSEPLALPWEV